MTRTWKSFWEEYRRGPVSTDADLFSQVGRTVNGVPISSTEFQRGVERIIERLALVSDDVVFEYCCGNGLISYELAPRVNHLIGIDFTPHLIEAAQSHRPRPNVEYHVGDALQPIERFLGADRPVKYLMSLALAHFSPRDLDVILGHLTAVKEPGSFRFFLTGIPDLERRWNFYDTPERRATYLEERRRDGLAGGVGRWWSGEEIRAAASARGLAAEIEPEPAGMTNYRMDALLL